MHTLLRIALALILPLLAVAILTHLRDDARERTRLTAAMARKQIVGPTAAEPALRAAESDQRYGHLYEDLPPPPRVLEITQRAMAAVDADRGFMPSILLAEECYEALGAAPLLEDRVYCLQIDAIGFGIELGAPQAWQEADRRSNDYFVASRFEARQLQFAPPVEDVPYAAERREGALDALGVVRQRVMMDYILHMHMGER